MNNRLISIGIVTLVAISGFLGFITFESDVVSAGTTWYVGSGPGNDSATIIGGISLAGEGDTIFVYSGTYNELVSVYKTINLTGEEKDNTIIDGGGSGEVLIIDAGWGNVSGFTIKNGSTGIHLDSSNNTISGNIISNNSDYGIRLSVSSNNTIFNNIIFNNGDGIYLKKSSNNTISYNNVLNNDEDSISHISSTNNTIINNNISSNSGYGIYLSDSQFINIKDNYFSNDGILIQGSQLSDYNTHNIPTNNLVNGKPIYYFVDNSSISIDNIPVGQLIIVNCTDVNISNIQINNTDVGIMMGHADNNTISFNNVSKTKYSILMGFSSNNSITNNIVADGEKGIVLGFSNYTQVANNIILNHSEYGLIIISSSNNTVSNNSVSLNFGGTVIESSFNITIKNNSITDNDMGIMLYGSSNNNSIIANSISSNIAGIHIISASINNLFNNNITHNDMGISIDSGSNNQIIGNMISSSNWMAIFLGSASNNNISENTLSSNNEAGISLTSSINNNITYNNIPDNDYGIQLILSSDSNTIIGNYVSSNYEGIYLGESSNNHIVENIISSNDGTGINLFSSANFNTIGNNTISNNDDGIKVWSSSMNNNITGNYISYNNWNGISIFSLSNNNNIIRNNISLNNDDGISIMQSSNNYIHLNNFFDNGNQADNVMSDNIWNDTYSLGGNYWSDYSPTCPDLYDGPTTPQTTGSSDGICDIPYTINDTGMDYYPLKDPVDIPAPLDFIPPATIINLNAYNPTNDSITLSWTAQGDDGGIGTANGYVLKYSTSGLITNADWDSVSNYSQSWTPLTAGGTETYNVNGLNSSTMYWFAIKAYDEAFNYGEISNSPSETTTTLVDTTPPATINDLTASNATQNSITLTWTAVADNGTNLISGNASYYDIRYLVDSPITDINWVTATQISGEPLPAVSGSQEAFLIIGLSSGVTYYFAIMVGDEVSNWSPVSNSPNATTIGVDETPPTIKEVVTTPSTQESGALVNISVNVTDNVGVDTVYVKIINPDSQIIGNYSMNYDEINGAYFYNSVYLSPGIYTFFIWAKDTSNIWNSTQSAPSQFVIQDTTIPTIIYTPNPSTQELGKKVNITTIVTDNVNVAEVWVQIFDPDDSELENITMNLLNSTDNYWYNITCFSLGNYEYIIWVKDSSENWNFAVGSFSVQDTIPPIANAGSNKTIPQGVIVTFDASDSSDGNRIDNYSWIFSYDGEEIILYGMNSTFKFEVTGIYLVALEVTDPSNNLAIDMIWITIYSLDSDNDGLTDYDEENIYETEPNEADTDGDGIDDGEEVASGTDPLKPDQTKKQEKLFFENYWWMFQIISLFIIAMLLFSLFKRKEGIKDKETINEVPSDPEEKPSIESSFPSEGESIEDQQLPPPPPPDDD